MSNKRSQRAELVGILDSILKQAEANTEAGGYEGGSSHPTADAKDNTMPAEEGARSAENSKDVKEEPNRGPAVDEAKENTADQNDKQMNIGITSKSTGTDPANEKPDKVDDEVDGEGKPGTDELKSGEYSGAIEALRQHAKKAEAIGLSLCSLLNKDLGTPTPRTAKTAAASVARPTATPAAADSAQAGYDLAGIFAGQDVPVEDKVAADKLVVATIAEVMDLADRRALKSAQFYGGHFTAEKVAADERAELIKLAADVGVDVETYAKLKQAGVSHQVMKAIKRAEDAAPMPPGAEGGAPPGAEGGAPGGGGGPEEEALLAALAGGQGGGAPGAGGPPMGGPPMGGAEGGGMPGGAGGGEEEELAMLQAIVDELGINPQQLQQAMSEVEGQGAGAAGAPPGAGAGGPPGAGPEAMAGGGGPPPPEMGPKVGSARWQPKTASAKKRYNEMRSYIQELTARSAS